MWPRFFTDSLLSFFQVLRIRREERGGSNAKVGTRALECTKVEHKVG